MKEEFILNSDQIVDQIYSERERILEEQEKKELFKNILKVEEAEIKAVQKNHMVCERLRAIFSPEECLELQRKHPKYCAFCEKDTQIRSRKIKLSDKITLRCEICGSLLPIYNRSGVCYSCRKKRIWSIKGILHHYNEVVYSNVPGGVFSFEGLKNALHSYHVHEIVMGEIGIDICSFYIGPEIVDFGYQYISEGKAKDIREGLEIVQNSHSDIWGKYDGKTVRDLADHLGYAYTGHFTKKILPSVPHHRVGEKIVWSKKEVKPFRKGSTFTDQSSGY